MIIKIIKTAIDRWWWIAHCLSQCLDWHCCIMRMFSFEYSQIEETTEIMEIAIKQGNKKFC